MKIYNVNLIHPAPRPEGDCHAAYQCTQIARDAGWVTLEGVSHVLGTRTETTLDWEQVTELPRVRVPVSNIASIEEWNDDETL